MPPQDNACHGLFSVYFSHSACPQVQGVVSVMPSQSSQQYFWPGCTVQRQPGWAQHCGGGVGLDGVFSGVFMASLLGMAFSFHSMT
jgi:hypothetical protein